MLLAISVIGIIAAVSFPLINNISSSSREVKLESDLAVLNSAVKSYLLFGGKLEGTESLEVVLAKLKSRASDETADQVVGLRGTFIDPRYEPVMQTEEEAASDSPRAYWDSSLGKFVTATTGPVGIKKFQLNEDYAAPETELTESRETAMSYAHNSTWIWDYEDAAAPTYLQPTPVAVALGSGASTSVPPVVMPPGSIIPPDPVPIVPPGPAPTVLLPPVFTVPTGSYPISSYNLSVGITDPNPVGSSIYYSIDFGPWAKYSGTGVSISPGKVLKAQAVPMDLSTGAYLFSTVTEGTYGASSESLLPPVINLSGGAFNLPSVDTINVSFANPNPGAISRIDYRLNGGTWQTYVGGMIQVKAGIYPNGALVESRAVSTSQYWLDSAIASASIGNITPPPDLGFTVTVSTTP